MRIGFIDLIAAHIEHREIELGLYIIRMKIQRLLELLAGFIALATLIQKDREVNPGLIDCSVLIQKRAISGDCSVGIA